MIFHLKSHMVDSQMHGISQGISRYRTDSTTLRLLRNTRSRSGGGEGVRGCAVPHYTLLSKQDIPGGRTQSPGSRR
jgi:hypothetical protein